MLVSRINPAVAVVLTVLGVVAATWWAASSQRASSDRAFGELVAAQNTLVAVAEQELAIQSYAQARVPALFLEFIAARREYDVLNREQLTGIRREGHGTELRLGLAEDRLVQRWERYADQSMTRLRDDPKAADPTLGPRTKTLGALKDANERLQRHIIDEQHDDQSAAAVYSVLALSLMGLMLGGGGLLLVTRSRRSATRRRDDAERRARDQALFREILQLAPNEGEAHRVIGAQLAHELPADADVSLMRRNNSQDRLEVVAASGPGVLPLAQGSEHPIECLAMKLNRRHDSGDGPEYLQCDLCGKAAGATSCAPVLVAGEVIGAVTVHAPGRLDELQLARVSETIDQSAPVLANLRNLAVAETRAATDALTGLPNRRAITETMHRMLAHAGRTISPLSAIMLDLDHFKAVNDVHGHDQGDAVLAAVADVLRSELRASDFAGRSGGEEFVVLLPDTGLEGASEVAEKLRTAIAGLDLPRLDRRVTASFGVAVFPEDGGEADTLLRSADRALYAAKRGGRNRVETVASAGTVTA